MALLSHWEAFLIFLAVAMAVLGAIGSISAFVEGVTREDVGRRTIFLLCLYPVTFSISIAVILTLVRFVW